MHCRQVAPIGMQRVAREIHGRFSQQVGTINAARIVVLDVSVRTQLLNLRDGSVKKLDFA
jgi:hypothetical protein